MEIRRIQRVSRSYYVIIPKAYLRSLKLKKGDFVRLQVYNGRLLIEKVREQKIPVEELPTEVK